MTNKGTIDAWLTKYALTKGIIKVKGELSPSRHNDTVYLRAKLSSESDVEYFYSPREWARTREEALTQAEDMKSRKLKSLKKQIQKIEDMKFA